jgi:hypothetical protein
MMPPAQNSSNFRLSSLLLETDSLPILPRVRYRAAQLKLGNIMHSRRASLQKPILRPILREEARKDIEDTGLLDHLLKVIRT